MKNPDIWKFICSSGPHLEHNRWNRSKPVLDSRILERRPHLELRWLLCYLRIHAQWRFQNRTTWCHHFHQSRCCRADRFMFSNRTNIAVTFRSQWIMSLVWRYWTADTMSLNHDLIKIRFRDDASWFSFSQSSREHLHNYNQFCFNIIYINHQIQDFTFIGI